MAYKESIATEIRDLFKTAPKGYSEHYLEHYDQKDVADTVNHLATIDPKKIQETFEDYTEKATIAFTK